MAKPFVIVKKELRQLEHNLSEPRPTLIVSPRRFGKTSLAINAIKLSKLPYAQFDFFSAINESDIENIILKAIGKLITQMEKGSRKALKVATDFFSGLSISLSLDKIGLSIEIKKKSVDPASNILSILERVEKLGERYNRKIVLFFDEFQQVYAVSENQAIEGVIRQVAQASKQLAFVFSGSNRNLLHQIFNDRKRPFYKLCDRITLERINEENYNNYLQLAAQETWRSMLESGVIRDIFAYTECHPYYMNLLCSRLWRQPKINQEDVSRVWHEYIMEERSQVGLELDLLTRNQRKLLITLARCGGTNAPRSNEFQMLAEMPGTTIAQALKFLEEKDYVYQNPSNKYYKVLDPMIKAVL